MIPGERLADFDAFLRQYERVRTAEGWGSDGAEYYRRLPYVAPSDPNHDIWRARSLSYEALIDRVIAPLEAERGRPLTILDLGAGNGWLSNRLASRGHHVAAIDLSTSTRDGLGACDWYERNEHSFPRIWDSECSSVPFALVQAEFDWLPFAGGQVDLIVFNASLHYSTNCRDTLAEALRVLRVDGRVVVMDSPVYRDCRSGQQMIRERDRVFRDRYGFPSPALAAEGFLTTDRLGGLAAELDLRLNVIQAIPWWHRAARSLKAWLREPREPAAFPIVVGRSTLARAYHHARPVRWVWRQIVRCRFHLFQRHRHNRLVLETVLGLPILVLPTVFNPKLLRTGEFLAQVLNSRLIPPGSTVLDLGTGSGVGAIVAAGWARRVIAVDVNPSAVHCAQINAALNEVDNRLDVRHGDLFGPVAGECFDVVLFNPPFYRGRPRDALDLAWRANDVVERFAAGLGDHLTADGHALVVLSSDGEAGAFLQAFRTHRMAIEVIARRDLINEVLTVYRLTKARR